MTTPEIKDLALAYESATNNFLKVVQALDQANLDHSINDGWSPRQIIHHLADSESQSCARLRRLVAEPGTLIQNFDENIYAQNMTLGYSELEITSSLAVFKAVRAASFELIKRLSPQQLSNSGEHSELGNYSISDWITGYTKHANDHAAQILANLNLYF